MYLRQLSGHHLIAVIRRDGKYRLPDHFFEGKLGEADIVVPLNMGNIGKFFAVLSLNPEYGFLTCDDRVKRLVRFNGDLGILA